MYLKKEFLKGPCILTGVCKCVGPVFIDSNYNFFQNHKIFHILLGNCSYSGNDIFMIWNKENIRESRLSFFTDMKSFWRVSQQFLFLIDKL